MVVAAVWMEIANLVPKVWTSNLRITKGKHLVSEIPRNLLL
jgi:hypothetical protein